MKHTGWAGWARPTHAIARAVGRLAFLSFAALFAFAGVSNAGVIKIERVTDPSVPGGLQAEVAFQDAMDNWAGVGVTYGLAGGAGNIWTLTQNTGLGAVLSQFDIVIGHIMESLPVNRDVTALVGYGSVDPVQYTGVLIDAFQPGGVTGVQLFDMQDILLFPTSSANVPNQAGWVLHGLYELYTSVLGAGNGYAVSHGNALAQENSVSTVLGGPLRRSDVLGQSWVGPGVIPVRNPFGALGADEWAAPFGVITPTGPGQVWLKGAGDIANLTDVLSGGFSFGPDGYSLPSADGDVRLIDVAFLPSPEPSTLLSLGAALLALAFIRRLKR